jgi:predicted RNA polymerase sigma factor
VLYADLERGHQREQDRRAQGGYSPLELLRLATAEVVLLRIEPSPLVSPNRAMAVAMHDGPDTGLALLDDLSEAEALRGYHVLPAARADLLRRLGRTAEAAAAYRAALDLVRQ